MLKLKNIIITAGFLMVVSGQVQAICVKNKTDLQLFYEIRNGNSAPLPVPKVKYYEGVLESTQKNCHAHSSNDKDWRIYRSDNIKIYKIDKGKKQLVCTKHVEGILNTLKVYYSVGTWWCLDRNDSDD